MYRHSAALGMTSLAHGRNAPPSPSSDDLNDNEAAICEELGKKRRQIDEEVVEFRAQKEKEFRDFEGELRLKKKRHSSTFTRSPAQPKLVNKPPGVLNFLAEVKKDGMNGKPDKQRYMSEVSKAPKTPLPSKPTLSLDKLNINGVSAPTGAQTSPAALTRSLSRSPSNSHMALAPPRTHTPRPAERDDTNLAGLFTPAFLPLLDDHSTTPGPGAEGKSEKIPAQKPEISRSHSSTSPPRLTPQQRALTTPGLFSPASLPGRMPSALRTASGGSLRTRKRVTFQLADSAIVEPSSSYEETASPSPRLSSPDNTRASSHGEEANHIDEAMGQVLAAKDPEAHSASDGHSNQKVEGNDEDSQMLDLDMTKSASHSEGNEDFVGASLLDPRRRSDSGSSTDSGSSRGFHDGLRQAEDGGSGVGFFELDEELESPGLVDRFELGEEDDMGGGVSHGGLKSGRPSKRASAADDEDGQPEYGSFGAGSVPINIVSRPFIGSYGH